MCLSLLNTVRFARFKHNHSALYTTWITVDPVLKLFGRSALKGLEELVPISAGPIGVCMKCELQVEGERISRGLESALSLNLLAQP